MPEEHIVDIAWARFVAERLTRTPQQIERDVIDFKKSLLNLVCDPEEEVTQGLSTIECPWCSDASFTHHFALQSHGNWDGVAIEWECAAGHRYVLDEV